MTATVIIVGIDIGGTATRFVVTENGHAVAEATRLTAELGAGPATARMDRISKVITGLVPGAAGPDAVGIGASGPVDVQNGEILNPATLPWFSGIGLARTLRERLGKPVLIENDSVACAVGEYHLGAGRGIQQLLTITLGTGVGGALLVGGRPFRGGHHAHPECGHIPVFGVDGDAGPCYCGLPGCWEPRASRRALETLLMPLLPAQTPLSEVVREGAARYPTHTSVRDAFHQYGTAVGRGLACLQTLYGPERIVVGGSVAKHLALFREGLETELSQDPIYTRPAKIVAATLGESAGALGAAALAERLLRDSASAM
ncbi:ROK family protein [Streptomyces sparsogenes]|uniref:ROK family protein n=1 Tax=Streptomyces sparsogenes TaxID=67365 RepID=UPI0033F6F0B6